jgi:hypothetical protein
MAAYRIIFHDENGEPFAETIQEHPHDDAAIDSVGRHSHPHEIHIWHGDRLVARVPPWPSGLR